MAASARRSIAITGGAGFIGARLVEAVAATGVPVRVLDRFDEADDPDRKWRRLSARVASGAVDLIVGDVRDRAMVARLLDRSVGTVVHLAAVAEVVTGAGGAADWMDVNATGTATLLAAATTAGVEHVILGSTGKLYGAGLRLAATETVEPRPSSAHDVSMRSMELLGRVHATDGLRVTSARIFPTYGPGQPPWGLVAQLVRWLRTGATGDAPTLAVGASSVIHVDDVVGALTTLIAGRTGDPYREYNLAHPEPIDRDRLVELVAAALAVVPPPQSPWPASSPPDGLVADVTRARDELGFVARIGLAEGLADLARSGA